MSMLRCSCVLFILLTTASFSARADIEMAKQMIIELIESHCDNPKPNPRVSADLDYDCSDTYEDADGEAQSMKYSVRLIPILKQDFNQDGIEDIALEIESMGPLGGSVYTNSAVHYLLLDKNNRITNQHQILLYAPFSEHIVEYALEGTRIYYSAIPNYRAHPEAYENGSLIDLPLEFEINWLKGAPISSYYQDNCQLAGIKNKALLKPNRGVTRSIGVDMHQYTQVIEEKMAIADLLVTADLNGCNERQVLFFIESKAGKSLPVLADVLQALLSKTYYNKQLRELLELDKQSQLVFGEVMALEGSWSGQIHINRDVDNSSIQINLLEKTS